MQKNKLNKYTNKTKEVDQSCNQDKSYYPTVSNNYNNQNSNSNNHFQNINIQQQQNAQGKFPQPAGNNKFPPGFGLPQQGHFNQPQQQVR